MALFIEIRKIEDNDEKAVYSFYLDESGTGGKVAILKSTGECEIIERPLNDHENKLGGRVCIKLIQHWRNNEFPEVTCWAS
jgi:hypothetical protein